MFTTPKRFVQFARNFMYRRRTLCWSK